MKLIEFNREPQVQQFLDQLYSLLNRSEDDNGKLAYLELMGFSTATQSSVGSVRQYEMENALLTHLGINKR